MSTRAIIAIPVKGGFETAWNWNDGSPMNLGRELRRYFKTKDQVKELITLHSFSTICGNKEKKELLHLFPNYTTEDNFIKLSNNRYALQRDYDGHVVVGKENGFFESIKEMLEQDLNYVYVFKNGEWKTYK